MKKRKMFKRHIAIFMAVCMLVSLATVSGAANDRNSKTNVEIVFEGKIDKEKADLITAALNGEEIVNPRSILCAFGHSLVEERCYVTKHCSYPDSPRCLLEVYKVLYCSRPSCDYISFTLIGIGRIYCCS